VLEPHEKLYHQLLAGEAQIAAKDADLWMGEHSLVQYLDEVVIPAFRFASGDQRRAVLGRKQTNEFKEATEEYVGLVQEASNTNSSHRAAPPHPGTTSNPRPVAAPRRRSSSPAGEARTSPCHS
jgi:hypothetical protein